MTTQTRVERNFRKAKNMVNRELVAFMTETTSAMSRLEDALPDEQLWHVDHAMGVRSGVFRSRWSGSRSR